MIICTDMITKTLYACIAPYDADAVNWTSVLLDRKQTMCERNSCSFTCDLISWYDSLACDTSLIFPNLTPPDVKLLIYHINIEYFDESEFLRYNRVVVNDFILEVVLKHLEYIEQSQSAALNLLDKLTANFLVRWNLFGHPNQDSVERHIREAFDSTLTEDEKAAIIAHYHALPMAIFKQQQLTRYTPCRHQAVLRRLKSELMKQEGLTEQLNAQLQLATANLVIEQSRIKSILPTPSTSSETRNPFDIQVKMLLVGDSGT